MKTITRRDAISGIAATSAGLALTFSRNALSASPNEDAKGDVSTARAFRGQHQPKPLAFDPTKLKGLSEKLIRSHWENNYGGAVKALNTVELHLAKLLSDSEIPPYMYGDLKREELIRTGSVVLPELYFGNLGGDPKPAGKFLTRSRNGLAVTNSGKRNSRRPQMLSAAVQVGQFLPGIHTAANSIITGPGIICTTRQCPDLYLYSTCMNMLITSITAQPPRSTSTRFCKTSTEKK